MYETDTELLDSAVVSAFDRSQTQLQWRDYDTHDNLNAYAPQPVAF